MRLVDAALTVEGLINSSGATVVGFYEDCLLHDAVDALKVLDGIPTQVLVGTRDAALPPPLGSLTATVRPMQLLAKPMNQTALPSLVRLTVLWC